MRALPPVTVALLAAGLIACGGSEAAIDAGVTSCDAVDGGFRPSLGTLPRDGGCESCGSWGSRSDEQGDVDCAAEYGDALPTDCRAYCREGQCLRYCPDECWSYPEVTACEPGQRACIDPTRPEQVYVCDPTCQPAGACRGCIDDADCQTELGPGAHCQRHCAYCCNENAGGDAGIPCVCI